MKIEFPFWKKKKNQEEVKDMTQDEKEIKKAEEDISEKGKDSQTKKDRVDESVGEQERRSGNENSQDAKDRVDESEGTKKADEKRAEEKKEERKEEEKAPAWASSLISSMEKIVGMLEKINAPATSTETTDSAAAERMEEAFGQRGGVFHGDGTQAAEKKMTPEDVAKAIRKIM